MKRLILLLGFVILLSGIQDLWAQQNSDHRTAFIRSLIIPGWGHYYNDRDSWTRGKVHLTTEAALIAAYFGYQHRISSIKTNYTTLAKLRSGVDISGRSRSFQIAISEFRSLEEYNEFQLRSRNWNRLLQESSENNWYWQNDRDREKYGELRSRRDRIRNQIPALFGLMVANRVISAISAYNRSSKNINGTVMSIEPVFIEQGSAGAVAKISIRI